MEDNRLKLAIMLARSAIRIQKFINMKAPESLIESERRQLYRLLLKFPVNAEAQTMIQGIEDGVYNQEQEHLHKTGYYDDIIKGD